MEAETLGCMHTPAELNEIGAARKVLARWPVASYFVLAFTVSWAGALAVAFPHMARHEQLPTQTGILMFPVMLLGPSMVGVLLTVLTAGRQGLSDLFSRMSLGQIRPRWYTFLFIPPALILAVLLFLSAFVNPLYRPNLFVFGIFFGIPAGFLEEIGWMGYAFPGMRKGTFRAALLLGLLWSLWHLPVINFLGTATPHGAYWFPFFLAFAFAMTAMRLIIVWIYVRTRSLILCQLMHASTTGALVVFSASHVTAAQETFWYSIYGCILWLVTLALFFVVNRGQSEAVV